MEPMLSDPLLPWLVFNSSGKEIDPFLNYPKDVKRESFWNTISIRRKDSTWVGVSDEERLKQESWEEEDGEYLSKVKEDSVKVGDMICTVCYNQGIWKLCGNQYN